MASDNYDTIIIGSGAGGAAAAYRLCAGGQRVLVLEKGGTIERSDDTLDPRIVVHEGRYKSKEVWRDGGGRRIVPEEYFNVGGKTKWYGAALMRFSAHEMRADPAFDCGGWPLAAGDLDAYYAEAERLLDVRTFAVEPDFAAIVAGLARRGAWRAQALPMGLAAAIQNEPHEASHFDGFASPRGLKADAEVALLERARASSRLTLQTNSPVVDLLPSDTRAQHVSGVRTADGRCYRARTIMLAAGALHSPRLLARYLDHHALHALAIRDNVGRNLKLHLLTAMVALSLTPKSDRLRKTTALFHDDFPHSSVQPLGFDGELIAGLIPAAVPRPLARVLGRHAYGFFLQTEDGSHRDNRVTTARDGVPVLDYDPTRCPAALREHRRLTARLRRDLCTGGYLSFAERIGVTGTAHACGTLALGSDPAHSVVDADGRVHGLDGLYVVDGSVLPRSSRVNPSLTIFAFALRVAARLLAAERIAA